MATLLDRLRRSPRSLDDPYGDCARAAGEYRSVTGPAQEATLRGRKADESFVPTHYLPPAAISPPRGVPSWALGGIYYNLSITPFGRVPLSANYGLYRALREAVPAIDGAILKYKNFIGVPEIEAAEKVKADIDLFLDRLQVNRVQVGFKPWLASHLDTMLTYGRSHTEIVLNQDRTEVWGLLPLHPKTIALRPVIDRYSVLVVQNQALMGPPVILPQLLLLNSYHDVRDDDPNGNSLLWGMPFMTEILVKMTKDLGNTWDRFGNPRFHVNWEPPDDFSDPTGKKSEAFRSNMQSRFNDMLQSAVQGDARDLFTTGKITVTVIGAEGETLAYDVPARTLVEQLLSKTHLPPMLFGFMWGSTYGMATVQASMLGEAIDNIRLEVEPALRYLIDFRQKLTGGSTDYQFKWPSPNLVDTLESARATFFTESGRAAQIQNEVALWHMGVNSPEDTARALRPDLEGLSDEEVRRRLKKLAQTPPEMLPAGGGGQNNQDGGSPTSGATGRGQARAYRQQELERALLEHRNGSGNGNDQY